MNNWVIRLLEFIVIVLQKEIQVSYIDDMKNIQYKRIETFTSRRYLFVKSKIASVNSLIYHCFCVSVNSLIYHYFCVPFDALLLLGTLFTSHFSCCHECTIYGKKLNLKHKSLMASGLKWLVNQYELNPIKTLGYWNSLDSEDAFWVKTKKLLGMVFWQ